MKSLREASGLSQLQLSRKCNTLTVELLRELESGARAPGYNAIKQIAAAVGVSETEMIHATGSRLRVMREKTGLSQQGLSDLCVGVSRSMVGAVEIGDRNPSSDVMKKIAAALGVPPKDVLDAVMADRDSSESWYGMLAEWS